MGTSREEVLPTLPRPSQMQVRHDVLSDHLDFTFLQSTRSQLLHITIFQERQHTSIQRAHSADQFDWTECEEDNPDGAKVGSIDYHKMFLLCVCKIYVPREVMISGESMTVLRRTACSYYSLIVRFRKKEPKEEGLLRAKRRGYASSLWWGSNPYIRPAASRGYRRPNRVPKSAPNVNWLGYALIQRTAVPSLHSLILLQTEHP